MARIKSKRSALQTLSCKFGGMAHRTPGAPMRAEDMCNFRILPDGTLKVRSGYTLKKQFPTGKKVRGFWEGTVGGAFLTFAVAGEKVYLLSGEEMDETAVGTIAAGEENRAAAPCAADARFLPLVKGSTSDDGGFRHRTETPAVHFIPKRAALARTEIADHLFSFARRASPSSS